MELLILWEQGVPVGPGGLTVSNFFSMSERLADAKIKGRA